MKLGLIGDIETLPPCNIAMSEFSLFCGNSTLWVVQYVLLPFISSSKPGGVLAPHVPTEVIKYPRSFENSTLGVLIFKTIDGSIVLNSSFLRRSRTKSAEDF